MKILFECTKYLPSLGGVEIGTHSLAKELIKNGHDVSVLCQNYDRGKSYEVIEKVKVYRYPAPKFHPVFRIWSSDIQQKNVKNFLKNFLLENVFDLIISRYFFYVKPTREIIPKTRIVYLQPAIIYLAFKKMMYNTRNIFEKFILFFRYKKTFHMEKEATSLADIIYSRNDAMDRIDKEMFDVPKNKILRYTQAIDLQKFKPKTLLKLKKQLGIEKTKNLITVSRFTPDKNNLELIRIFAKLKSTNIKLIIIGDGYEKGVLEREVKKLKIENRVLFLGEKKNPEKFYNLGDVFVLASKQEGIGTVFLEAISCGIPIIGFKSNYPENITPTKDIIENSQCGFAVKDNKEMVEKIDKILSDKKLLMKMSKNAIIRSKNYSKGRIVKLFLKSLSSNN